MYGPDSPLKSSYKCIYMNLILFLLIYPAPPHCCTTSVSFSIFHSFNENLLFLLLFCTRTGMFWICHGGDEVGTFIVELCDRDPVTFCPLNVCGLNERTMFLSQQTSDWLWRTACWYVIYTDPNAQKQHKTMCFLAGTTCTVIHVCKWTSLLV